MEANKPELAGFGARLINFIVDMVTFLIIWFVISVFLVLIGFDKSYIDDKGESIPLIPTIIIIPIFWIYYLFTEFLFQQTFGKFLTRTKVVTKNGNKPTILQILGRTLSRSIPFEYLSYLFTINGIHDRLSGTRVIKKEKKV